MIDPSACSFRRVDDPSRAYCNGKSYHRRYSRCDPEHLLDSRQLVLSRCAFPFLLSGDTPPRLPPFPTDTAALQCSYLMFHWVTGIPFGSELHGGAYDDLTLWEQIDGGAQNTPSRKWLFSVPVGLCVFLISPFPQMLTRPRTQNSFLLSTHYTNYNPWLFAINLSALIFVLVPKLPMVRPYRRLLDGCVLSMTTDVADSKQAHRQRLRILPNDVSGNVTPISPTTDTSGTSTPPDHLRALPEIHITDAQFR
jgi:ORMDL family